MTGSSSAPSPTAVPTAPGAIPSAILADRSIHDRLVLSGEDRARFLQGLVTCDVAALEPGVDGSTVGAYGFAVDPKGRILSDLVVWAEAERHVLRVPRGCAAVLAEHFGKYLIADRVEIAAEGVPESVLVTGDGAAALLEDWSGSAPPSAGWERVVVELGGSPYELVRDPGYGIAAWVVSGLEGGGSPSEPLIAAGAEPEAPETAEALRIVAGRPRWGVDFEADLPQETGIEEAVSYTKGCYLGQEIVARVHYLGRPPKVVRSIDFPEDTPPKRGASLRAEGTERPVGMVTSVARTVGRSVGLAMLQQDAASDGAVVLTEDGIRGTVRAPGTEAPPPPIHQ